MSCASKETHCEYTTIFRELQFIGAVFFISPNFFLLYRHLQEKLLNRKNGIEYSMEKLPENRLSSRRQSTPRNMGDDPLSDKFGEIERRNRRNRGTKSPILSDRRPPFINSSAVSDSSRECSSAPLRSLHEAWRCVSVENQGCP